MEVLDEVKSNYAFENKLEKPINQDWSLLKALTRISLIKKGKLEIFKNKSCLVTLIKHGI